MSKRDGMNDMHVVPAIVPVAAAIADNTVQTSAAIDVRAAGSCTFVITTGTIADADATFTAEVQECATVGGTYTAVADADLVGTELLGSLTFADDGECRKIGYKGNMGFVKLVITPANNTGAFPFSAIAVLGDLARRPSANPPQ